MWARAEKLLSSPFISLRVPPPACCLIDFVPTSQFPDPGHALVPGRATLCLVFHIEPTRHGLVNCSWLYNISPTIIALLCVVLGPVPNFYASLVASSPGPLSIIYTQTKLQKVLAACTPSQPPPQGWPPGGLSPDYIHFV